mgnify:CR=1 FL=1
MAEERAAARAAKELADREVLEAGAGGGGGGEGGAAGAGGAAGGAGGRGGRGGRQATAAAAGPAAATAAPQVGGAKGWRWGSAARVGWVCVFASVASVFVIRAAPPRWSWTLCHHAIISHTPAYLAYPPPTHTHLCTNPQPFLT